MSKYQEISKFDDEHFNDLRDRLVPACGQAATVAGEIIRAMDRLVYRWFNDGDKPYQGYGNETCNSSYRYLSRILQDSMPELTGYCTDEEYDEMIFTLEKNVDAFLNNHPNLLIEENTFDSRKSEPEDYNWDNEDDDWDDEDSIF